MELRFSRRELCVKMGIISSAIRQFVGAYGSLPLPAATRAIFGLRRREALRENREKPPAGGRGGVARSDQHESTCMARVANYVAMHVLSIGGRGGSTCMGTSIATSPAGRHTVSRKSQRRRGVTDLPTTRPAMLTTIHIVRGMSIGSPLCMISVKCRFRSRARAGLRLSRAPAREETDAASAENVVSVAEEQRITTCAV